MGPYLGSSLNLGTFGVLLVKVLYYFGDLTTDPTLTTLIKGASYSLGFSVEGCFYKDYYIVGCTVRACINRKRSGQYFGLIITRGPMEYHW